MSVAKTGLSFKINAAQRAKLLENEGGPVGRAVHRAGKKAVQLARQDLRAKNLVDTGDLIDSIDYQINIRQQSVSATIFSDAPYAKYVHEGTRGPIFPTRAKLLRFKPKGATAFVFTPSVRGTRETGNWSPFLRNALKQMRKEDFL